MATMTARVIVEGRNFCEGPRWHEGRFWFSDFYAHEVCSVGLQGDVRVEANLAAEQPSGLGWLPNGELLVVGMTKRQVLRRHADSRMAVHADLASIATFHANDMLVTPDGSAYVGDFGFDLDAYIEAHGPDGLFGALATDPTPFLSRITRIAPDGTASVAADHLLFPNGMALIDGGRTLVVAQSLGMELTAFDRSPDGSLSNRRTWAALQDSMIAPDGICADEHGGIWVANPLAPAVVRVEQGGTITDTVKTSNPTFACALGGGNGRHLLICTAPSSNHTEASASRDGQLELIEL